MKHFLLLVTCATLASGIFEIDDLLKMVKNPADRLALRKLDKDKNTVRSEIKRQVMEIVARQTKDVQDAYKKILAKDAEEEKMEHEAEMWALKAKGASKRVLDVAEELYRLENDLSLSENQEDAKKRQLKATLTPAERKLLDD